jgi:hypothetical protein
MPWHGQKRGEKFMEMRIVAAVVSSDTSLDRKLGGQFTVPGTSSTAQRIGYLIKGDRQ